MLLCGKVGKGKYVVSHVMILFLRTLRAELWKMPVFAWIFAPL